MTNSISDKVASAVGNVSKEEVNSETEETTTTAPATVEISEPAKKEEVKEVAKTTSEDTEQAEDWKAKYDELFDALNDKSNALAAVRKGADSYQARAKTAEAEVKNARFEKERLIAIVNEGFTPDDEDFFLNAKSVDDVKIVAEKLKLRFGSSFKAEPTNQPTKVISNLAGTKETAVVPNALSQKIKDKLESINPNV